MSACDKSAIKGIGQRVSEDKRPREKIGDGRAFAEDEQRGGNRGQRAAGEGHDGCLRDVGEEEHGGCDAEAKTDGLDSTRDERAPKVFVVGEEENALHYMSVKQVLRMFSDF